MRYFIMKQDMNLLYGIKIKDQQPGSSGVLYLDGQGDEIRPDFIETPVVMIAAELKKIIDLYEDDIVFKNIALIHLENNLQYDYCEIKLPCIEAVSELTEYYPNLMEKHLVLNRDKIGLHQCFTIQDSKMCHPVVSLAVAEALLRRKVRGIIFEEVETDNGRL